MTRSRRRQRGLLDDVDAVVAVGRRLPLAHDDGLYRDTTSQPTTSTLSALVRIATVLMVRIRSTIVA